VTSVCRVLNIIAFADSAYNAYYKVYKVCEHPFFKNQYYRKDIGQTVPLST